MSDGLLVTGRPGYGPHGDEPYGRHAMRRGCLCVGAAYAWGCTCAGDGLFVGAGRAWLERVAGYGRCL